MMGMAAPNPNGDIPVQSPPDDSISSLNFSPRANLLVAGSWNKQVRCWEVQANGATVPKAVHSHQAPVLCTAFSDDGVNVFSGSCDKTAKVWDLNTGRAWQVAAHEAPIKEIAWVPESKLLATGSWDKTIKYWDLRSPNPVLSVQLPERVYAMAVSSPLVTVATANRGIIIYNLAKPNAPFRSYESPLKMQSRCVANFIDRTGFALGSIEGRVAIQYCDEKSSKNFAFKCHRHNDEVYAVNSIAFHPKGTFATAGSDGGYVFWDKDSKQRLKLFKRCDQSIPCATFNHDGSIYAYALSYDWSRGVQHYDKQKPNQILLHAVKAEEVEPRGRQAGGGYR